MKSLIAAITALFISSGGAALVAQDAAANPREKLETAIPEMIRLLEAKDYKTLLTQFAPPKVVKEISDENKLEEFAAGFGKEKGPNLLKALQSLKDAKPEMSEEGKVATYQLKEEIAGKKSIKFGKIDKYWYIAN